MKVRFYVETNKIGSRNERIVEVDDDEWAEMSDRNKEEMLNDLIPDLCDMGWEEIS